MNEDWLNKVHDRMNGYETDEPDNLWAAIESKRAEMLSAPQRGRKSSVAIWVRRGIAAAAMIAVAVTAGIYFANTGRDLSRTPVLAEAPAKADEGKIKSVWDLRKEETAPVRKSAKRIAQAVVPEPPSDTRPTVPSTEPEAQPAPVKEDTVESTVSQPETVDIAKTAEEPARKRETALADNTFHAPAKTGSGNKMSLSVYSSGGFGMSANSDENLAYGNNWMIQATPPAYWNPTGMNPMPRYDGMVKHHLPVRAGIAFTYSFGDRLGLETGLSYAYLASDIEEDDGWNYYYGEQKLHYIGIPLNVKYRVCSWKRLDLYASAGAMAEKCVSARIDKNYLAERRPETVSLPDMPLQWSVNASVGVQCRLVNAMGIFVEPGVSYYFDDGTEIPTIYKDKPLNFNLNMGLRFTFGK